jgi:hypothetical protein
MRGRRFGVGKEAEAGNGPPHEYDRTADTLCARSKLISFPQPFPQLWISP